jgi:Mrp family chromosome partitioning ATPase
MLTREIAAIDADIAQARSRLAPKRGDAPAAKLDAQQVAELASEALKARTARANAEARARTARDLLDLDSPESIPEVQASSPLQELIARRIRAEHDKADAEISLLPGHPRMKQLTASVADLRRQIAREAAVIVEGLEREAKQLAQREQAASASLEEIKTRLNDNTGDVARLAGLEDQAKAKRLQLAPLQADYEAVRTGGEAKAAPVEAQVIAAAQPSGRQTWIGRAQLAVLAGVSTLILGFAVVIMRELLAGRRRDQRPASEPASAPPPAMPEALSVIAETEKPSPFAERRSFIEAAEEPASASAPPVRPVSTISVPPAVAIRQNPIEAVAHRLLGNAEAQSGYRSILVGSAPGIDVREEAADLAGMLTAADRHVIIVDWAVDGIGLSQALGVKPVPGVMDLLSGRATFEDTIQRLPDGDAHIVPCGSATPSDHMDADRINMIFDALDEAYDHIIVAGRYEPIRDLFLTIQGRFDAAIEVHEDGDASAFAPSADSEPFSTFLDFEVTEIDIIRIDRAPVTRSRPASRAQRDAAVPVPA